MFACLFPKHIRNQSLPCKPDQTVVPFQKQIPLAWDSGRGVCWVLVSTRKNNKALTRRALLFVRSLTMTYFGSDLTSIKPI
jgi:hypothetical protein